MQCATVSGLPTLAWASKSILNLCCIFNLKWWWWNMGLVILPYAAIHTVVQYYFFFTIRVTTKISNKETNRKHYSQLSMICWPTNQYTAMEKLDISLSRYKSKIQWNHNLLFSHFLKFCRTRWWAGHVVCTRKKKNAYSIWVGSLKVKATWKT
jgi:hypothetical protein